MDALDIRYYCTLYLDFVIQSRDTVKVLYAVTLGWDVVIILNDPGIKSMVTVFGHPEMISYSRWEVP